MRKVLLLSVLSLFLFVGNVLATSTCPYAWYHLNETSGTAVNDSSGNNRNGTTINSPTWVAGKLNNSIQLNGNQGISLGNIAGFERTDSFSAEAWIYPTTSVATLTIVSKATSAPAYTGWLVAFNNAKIYVYLINNFATINEIIVSTTKTFPTSAWSHIVVTYDGTSLANGVKIYVNGTLQNTDVGYNSLTGSLINSEPTQIGSGFGGLFYFYGKLDEVTIYNYTLTAEQATLRWNGGAGTEGIAGCTSPSCACLDWVNGTCFNITHRTQTRTCIPDSCDIQTQYIPDASCFVDYSFPTYTNFTANVTNNTALNVGDCVNISALWNDNVQLANYRNSSSINSGSWTDSSWQSFVTNYTNFTMCYPSSALGGNWTMKITATDTSNNTNSTGTFFFTNTSLIPCVCGNWTNEGCYNTTHRLQTRNCTPSLCDIESRYVSNSSCNALPLYNGSADVSAYLTGYCLDNTTIKMNVTYQGQLIEVIKTCPYNCDLKNNVCYNSTSNSWLIAIAIIAGLIIFIILLKGVFG